jgi:hypothetical protein
MVSYVSQETKTYVLHYTMCASDLHDFYLCLIKTCVCNFFYLLLSFEYMVLWCDFTKHKCRFPSDFDIYPTGSHHFLIPVFIPFVFVTDISRFRFRPAR